MCRGSVGVGLECSGPATVFFGDSVNLAHEADGFADGDNDLLVVGHVVVREGLGP